MLKSSSTAVSEPVKPGCCGDTLGEPNKIGEPNAFGVVTGISTETAPAWVVVTLGCFSLFNVSEAFFFSLCMCSKITLVVRTSAKAGCK